MSNSVSNVSVQRHNRLHRVFFFGLVFLVSGLSCLTEVK